MISVNLIIQCCNFDEIPVDSNDIEFKRKDFDWRYEIGYFHKLLNKPHGICRYVWKNSRVFEGMYCNGSPNGFGRVIFSDGGHYVGMWKDGDFHGKGKRIHADGTIDEGDFEDNEFINE